LIEGKCLESLFKKVGALIITLKKINRNRDESPKAIEVLDPLAGSVPDEDQPEEN